MKWLPNLKLKLWRKKTQTQIVKKKLKLNCDKT